MAKPKTPLLSLGASGTIADTLTFQRRGRRTIVRQKPIPTDPKSPAQLAQRQVYRDAVDAWHALSPEEQQAWRGVCPGLTAYQCFMKSELKPAPPPPPPEEQTEEQIQNDIDGKIAWGSFKRYGQRLWIPNRQLTKLAFLMRKVLNPAGTIYFQIWRIDPDELIYDQLVCLAAELPADDDWVEKALDEPQTINEEVRIAAYATGSDLDNYVVVRWMNAQVKENEYMCRYSTGPWSEYEATDCAYRYKYYEL